MSSKQEEIYLITMKRDETNHDCNWLYDKYIKQMLKRQDQLITTKHDDKNECYFFIQKKNISEKNKQ